MDNQQEQQEAIPHEQLEKIEKCVDEYVKDVPFNRGFTPETLVAVAYRQGVKDGYRMSHLKSHTVEGEEQGLRWVKADYSMPDSLIHGKRVFIKPIQKAIQLGILREARNSWQKIVENQPCRNQIAKLVITLKNAARFADTLKTADGDAIAKAIYETLATFDE